MPTPLVPPDHDPRISPLSTADIRARFLVFFAARRHTRSFRAPGLVPAGDQTLLSRTRGMVQFKEVFTGAGDAQLTTPGGVDYQRVLAGGGPSTTTSRRSAGPPAQQHLLPRCSATGASATTFKRGGESTGRGSSSRSRWGSRGERLAATTYTDDEVAWAIWRDEIGLPPERMAAGGNVDAGDDNNFWRMADTGPCGPCQARSTSTEVPTFPRGRTASRDHSEKTALGGSRSGTSSSWSSSQRPDGRRAAAVPRACGRHRNEPRAAFASVLQQVPSNFDTDVFTPIHARMRELMGHDPEVFEAERFSYQVIADHSPGDDLS